MISEALQVLGISPLVYAAIILTVIYFFLLRPDQITNIPPIPEKGYPFFGHATIFRKNPRGKMEEWKRSSGNIFSIYFGKQLTVVLNGYDMIKEAFVKQADIFSDRVPSFLAQTYPGAHKGVLRNSGEDWKEQRTVALSILRMFGMGRHSLAEKIDEEVDCYLNALSELNGKPRDIRILTNSCVSNVICNIIVGKRFDLEDKQFQLMLCSLNEQAVLLGQSGLLQIYPWLRFVPGDPFGGKRILQGYDEILTFFKQRFIEPLTKDINDDDDDCFITAYTQELRKRKRGGKPTTMDEENLANLIFDLFVAGSETTSTTTLWFVLLMMHYPKIYDKAYKEIIDVVGTERRPSMQDKSKLNYFNAVIFETQRFSSIVPFAIPHKCSQTTTLGGYTIPKGTTIIPNFDSVLLDEQTWPDPLTFRPERFLDNKGHLVGSEEFVPFSVGRRICLGESLAKMELFLFSTCLCQKFDIQPASKDGELPPLKGIFGITCAPEAFDVKFIEGK